MVLSEKEGGSEGIAEARSERWKDEEWTGVIIAMRGFASIDLQCDLIGHLVAEKFIFLCFQFFLFFAAIRWTRRSESSTPALCWAAAH